MLPKDGSPAVTPNELSREGTNYLQIMQTLLHRNGGDGPSGNLQPEEHGGRRRRSFVLEVLDFPVVPF